ncbi:MAG: hypothetical protein KQA31_02500 [Candidatus Aenigmarchaeota archaeon]|nr:hypothetical protein [Candidatus Aenigmarchaeota archaeon]
MKENYKSPFQEGFNPSFDLGKVEPYKGFNPSFDLGKIDDYKGFNPSFDLGKVEPYKGFNPSDLRKVYHSKVNPIY